MTFLGSFFTDIVITETLWICSLASPSVFHQIVPTEATEKCISELFSFDFSSSPPPPPKNTQLYACRTYICTSKIQWWAEAERKEKKSLESFKSTPRFAAIRAGGFSLRGSAGALSSE